jgi:hypothetical protein
MQQRNKSTLLCSAYTLEDQHAFGKMLALLGLVVYALVLVSTPRWLVQYQQIEDAMLTRQNSVCRDDGFRPAEEEPASTRRGRVGAH